MILPYIQAFVLLLVIIDPLVSMAAFISMTEKMKKADRRDVATKAVLVAAIPLFLFIFFGNVMLQVLKVDILTFKAAGGLILILLGIQLSLGLSLPKKKERGGKDHSAIASVIGTPLITGPATIATGIILSNDFGQVITAAAGLTALTIVWVVLMIGSAAYRFMGRIGIRVISTMMGLITIAWGMTYIKEGLLASI